MKIEQAVRDAHAGKRINGRLAFKAENAGYIKPTKKRDGWIVTALGKKFAGITGK